jgi:hypothetical protein
MNWLKNLICSATRVAPAVLAWALRCVVVVVVEGFGFVERLRVWPSAAVGAIRIAVNRAIAMRFNMFLLNCGD